MISISVPGGRTRDNIPDPDVSSATLGYCRLNINADQFMKSSLFALERTYLGYDEHSPGQ